MGIIGTFASTWLNGQALRAKVLFGVIAGVCAGGGTWYLYSSFMHTLNGEHASALLVERVEECKAEFHPRGESRRKEAMPCQRAYAFREIAGEKKVKVTEQTFVLVRFALSNGMQHEVKVDEYKVRAGSARVGEPLAVVFDPRDPNDVRSALSWGDVRNNLLVIAAGLAALVLLFLGRVVRLVSPLFGSRSAASHRHEETVGASRADEAVSRAVAARQMQGAAGRQRVGGQVSGSRPGGNTGPAGARRQFGIRT